MSISVLTPIADGYGYAKRTISGYTWTTMAPMSVKSFASPTGVGTQNVLIYFNPQLLGAGLTFTRVELLWEVVASPAAGGLLQLGPVFTADPSSSAETKFTDAWSAVPIYLSQSAFIGGYESDLGGFAVQVIQDAYDLGYDWFGVSASFRDDPAKESELGAAPQLRLTYDGDVLHGSRQARRMLLGVS